MCPTIWSKQDHVIVYHYGQDKNDNKLTEVGACHAAVGPPPQLVPPDHRQQIMLPWMVTQTKYGCHGWSDLPQVVPH